VATRTSVHAITPGTCGPHCGHENIGPRHYPCHLWTPLWPREHRSTPLPFPTCGPHCGHESTGPRQYPSHLWTPLWPREQRSTPLHPVHVDPIVATRTFVHAITPAFVDPIVATRAPVHAITRATCGPHCGHHAITSPACGPHCGHEDTAPRHYPCHLWTPLPPRGHRSTPLPLRPVNPIVATRAPVHAITPATCGPHCGHEGTGPRHYPSHLWTPLWPREHRSTPLPLPPVDPIVATRAPVHAITAATCGIHCGHESSCPRKSACHLWAPLWPREHRSTPLTVPPVDPIVATSTPVHAITLAICGRHCGHEGTGPRHYPCHLWTPLWPREQRSTPLPLPPVDHIVATRAPVHAITPPTCGPHCGHEGTGPRHYPCHLWTPLWPRGHRSTPLPLPPVDPIVATRAPVDPIVVTRAPVHAITLATCGPHCGHEGTGPRHYPCHLWTPLWPREQLSTPLPLPPVDPIVATRAPVHAITRVTCGPHCGNEGTGPRHYPCHLWTPLWPREHRSTPLPLPPVDPIVATRTSVHAITLATCGPHCGHESPGPRHNPCHL
jgi:hypothetical protein